MIIPIRVKKVPKREFHPFVPPSPQPGPSPDPEPIEGYTIAIFSDDLPAFLVENPDEELDVVVPFSCDGVDYAGISISGQAPYNMSYVLSWKEPAQGGGPDEAVQVTDNGAFVDRKYKNIVIENGEDLENFLYSFDWVIDNGFIEFVPPLPESEAAVSITMDSELDFTGMSDKTWTIVVYHPQNIQ